MKSAYDLTGTILRGKYYLESIAGEGNMGRVYRGRIVGTGDLVAVKVILPGRLKDPRRKARAMTLFEREANALQSLRHHNILSVYEYGIENETVFIVMEWLEGHDLEVELTKGPLSLERTSHILYQICDALNAAHSHRKKIIHLDLKPSNVFLVNSPQDYIKLIDFGLARAMITSMGITLSMGVGTPLYMAPELFSSPKPIATRKCDVYSLGATTYQMLTGECAFSDADVVAIMRGNPRVPPSIRNHNPDVPELIDELIRRALSFSPAYRPNSVKAFYDEFARAILAIDTTWTIKTTVQPKIYESYWEKFFNFSALNPKANLFLIIILASWQVSAWAVIVSTITDNRMLIPYAWLWWAFSSVIPIAVLYKRKISFPEFLKFYGRCFLLIFLVPLSPIILLIAFVYFSFDLDR
jgi:serine/threonine protein kinase